MSLLLEHTLIHVDATDKAGWSASHWAVSLSAETVEIDKTQPFQNGTHGSASHSFPSAVSYFQAASGSADSLRLVLENSPRLIQAVNLKFETALHLAARENNVDVRHWQAKSGRGADAALNPPLCSLLAAHNTFRSSTVSPHFAHCRRQPGMQRGSLNS